MVVVVGVLAALTSLMSGLPAEGNVASSETQQPQIVLSEQGQ